MECLCCNKEKKVVTETFTYFDSVKKRLAEGELTHEEEPTDFNFSVDGKIQTAPCHASCVAESHPDLDVLRAHVEAQAAESEPAVPIVFHSAIPELGPESVPDPDLELDLTLPPAEATPEPPPLEVPEPSSQRRRKQR